MGFYGKINNVAKSQFTFDKIYSTRYAMDAGVETDNVFVGRYVLVEYGESTINDKSLYKEAFYNKLYTLQDGWLRLWTDETGTEEIVATADDEGTIYAIWYDAALDAEVEHEETEEEITYRYTPYP